MKIFTWKRTLSQTAQILNLHQRLSFLCPLSRLWWIFSCLLSKIMGIENRHIYEHLYSISTLKRSEVKSNEIEKMKLTLILLLTLWNLLKMINMKAALIRFLLLVIINFEWFSIPLTELGPCEWSFLSKTDITVNA